MTSKRINVKWSLLSFSCAIGILLQCGAAAANNYDLSRPPNYPFGQHIRYAAGSTKPNHLTQIQRDDDIRALYDGWKSRYLAQAGIEPDGYPRYRVKVGASPTAKTVSEGQGYGMIIIALMAGYDASARTIFDGLWEFAKDHPSSIDSRLMDWSVNADELLDGDGNDSAFDGDSDMAYALLLAEAQWGNGGRFNYGDEAATLLNGILQSTIGPDSMLPMLGDWVDPYGRRYNQYTVRPSDFAYGHFRAFARATGDKIWLEVLHSTQAVIKTLQDSHGSTTGLVPDFSVPISSTDTTPRPAPPSFLEGPNDGEYSYNSGRVPWRIATDALLNGDAVSRQQAQKMSRWIEYSSGGDPFSIHAGYTLDGAHLPGSGYFTTFFASTFGVTAMLDPAQQFWLNSVYDSIFYSNEGYYEDSVTLLCLLVMNGNFWDPTTIQSINTNPTTTNDNATTGWNQAVDIPVLANDRDIDGDTLIVSLVTQGANGSVEILGSDKVTYTPNTGFIGIDRFTYTASDGKGGIAVGSVSVTINPDRSLDMDGDGYTADHDCNDEDPTINPGAPDTKHDGIDQDCNGYDLTIDIIRAIHKRSRNMLIILANSTLSDKAELRAVVKMKNGKRANFALRWNGTKNQWQKKIKGFTNRYGSLPVSIRAYGIEGSSYRPVKLR